MLKELLAGFRALVKGNEEQAWDFQDRRKLVRMRCHYDVKAEAAGAKSFSATITDMGLRGMRMRCFHRFKPGDWVKVWTPIPIVGGTSDPIACKVVWVRQPDRNLIVYCGVTYEADGPTMGRSWVKYFLKELGFTPEVIHSKRKFVRAECFLNGEYLDANRSTREMKVCNLGVGGACIESRNRHQLGDKITLRIGPHEDLPMLEISGKIAKDTAEGGQHLYGIEFDEMNTAQTKGLSQYLQHLMKSTWSESLT